MVHGRKDFYLAPGDYQYQFVVDGQIVLDPNHPKISNLFDGYNSLFKVKGTALSSKPSLKTRPIESDKIIVQAQNEDNIIALWNNHLIKPYQRQGNIYYFAPPEHSKKKERSFFRAWAVNKYDYSHDILVPLHYGKPIEKADKVNRTDHHSWIMYALFLDRFVDGNPSNTEKVNRPDLLKDRVDYYGGDLSGVIQTLDKGYFTDLGVNTIWLSPITLNPKGAWGQVTTPITTKFSGYHGYWPISSLSLIQDLVQKKCYKNSSINFIPKK